MSIANLCNTKVIVQKKGDGSVNTIGGTSSRDYEDWVSDVYVRIQPLSGDERNLYDQTVSKVTHKIYLEPISNSDIVATTCRIKYGTEYYDINTVLDIDEQGRLLTLECDKEE